MNNEKIEQIYKVIKLMMNHFEEHEFEDGATSKLFINMQELDRLMTPYNPTVEQVISLRSLTGEGMVRCNKALRMSRGDQEKAIDFMRMGRV